MKPFTPLTIDSMIRSANALPRNLSETEFTIWLLGPGRKVNFGDGDRAFERDYLDREWPRDRFQQFRHYLTNQAKNRESKELDVFLTMLSSRETLQQLANVKNELIGACEVCGNFFKRQRKDKTTCGDRCSTRRRIREWRRKQQQRRDK